MAGDKNDRSPYELARLERIKRNNAYLKSIGLGLKEAFKAPKPKPKPLKRKRPVVYKQRVPTRSSKRIREAQEREEQAREIAQSYESSIDEKKEELENLEKGVDYDVTPQDPDQLDDSEFQVYVAMRAWRLDKSRELEIEAYKVFQNRTICEIVRRRRNDKRFANRKVMGDDSGVEKDLLVVWGIGPSKAEQGGFGWEALDILGAPENETLLENSRKDCRTSPR